MKNKSILVYEPEFARVMRVAARVGSTLSPILRDAWDRGDLRVMTKERLKATGAHICILGHITLEELKSVLTFTDAASGFGNRLLVFLVKRSKRLPIGGSLEEGTAEALAGELSGILDKARKIEKVTFAPETEAGWKEFYHGVSDEDQGMAGAMTARAEAQTLRLALIYALLDGSKTIEPVHLEAARAVWDFSEGSVQAIFGDATGDPQLDRLIAALAQAGEEGLNFTEQSRLFAGNLKAARLKELRGRLEKAGLAETVTEETHGRPVGITRIRLPRST